MIIVSPLSAVPTIYAEGGVSHVLSILSDQTRHPDLGLPATHHRRLTFHDIIAPAEGFSVPTSEHVSEMIGYIEDWDRSGFLLIHCFAGISRSTAAAFTAMCLLNPQEDEADLAQELRGHSPSATPNRLIVALADDLLKRDGRMLEAVDRIGRGVDAAEGTIFRWNPVR